jgi:hypothetical protein
MSSDAPVNILAPARGKVGVHAMAWSDTYSFLFPPSDPFPPRLADIAVAWHLFFLSYHAQTINKVLEWISAHGSVEICPWLYDEHRADVEAMLPSAPASCWARQEAFIYNIGADDGNGNCSGL